MDTTITDDISAERIKNPDILRLHGLWERTRPAGGLPRVGSLDVEGLWCSGDLMLVVRKEPGDFEYLRYGTNISLAAGFDMTGKRTSTLQSAVVRCFVRCYQRCITECIPLYTTNPAAHAALVTGWERLLLPLLDDEGIPRLVLAYNRPLDFKHQLLSRVLDATEDKIIGVTRAATPDSGAEDFSVLAVNHSAEALFGRTGPNAVGHRLSELVPKWDTLEWGKALTRSVNKNEAVRIEWRQSDQGREFWYRVAVNPFDDGAVITMSDISELKEKELILEGLNRELERLANTDPLTGANNRRRLLSLAAAEIQRAERYGLPLSAVMIDVDNFKRLNDQLGHDAGDEALIAIVKLLHRELRGQDCLGRMGGRGVCRHIASYGGAGGVRARAAAMHLNCQAPDRCGRYKRAGYL